MLEARDLACVRGLCSASSVGAASVISVGEAFVVVVLGAVAFGDVGECLIGEYVVRRGSGGNVAVGNKTTVGR